MSVDVGDKAPDFKAPTNGDGTLALKDLKGKTVVLYFYPKDDTPGCTKQAEGFRDNLKKFAKAGAEVVGVSKDPVKKHDKFVDKYSLNFTLLSDEEVKICEAYGVWVEKSMYGRKYMGIDRSTFIIDGKGVIQHVWRKVKVSGHVEEVLAAVQELGKQAA